MVGMLKKLRSAGVVFLFILLATVGSGYLFRNSLVAFVIRDQLAPLVAENGITVDFDRVQTDLFSSAQLRQVRIVVALPDGTMLRGDIERLALHYDGMELLNDYRRGLSRAGLVLEQAQFHIAVAAGEKQGQQFDSFSLFLPPLPWWLPAIDLQKNEVHLSADFGKADLQGLDLTMGAATPDNPARKINGQAASISQVGLPMPRIFHQVGIDLDYAANSLLISSLSVDGAVVAEGLRFAADGRDRISCRGSLHLLQGVADLDVALEGPILSGTLNSHAVELAGIPSSLGESVKELAGSLSLRSFFEVDLQQPDRMRANLSLALQDGKIGEVTIHSLRTELQVQDGEIRVSTMDLASGGNTLQLREAQTSFAALRQEDFWKIARQSGAEFSLSFENWQEIVSLLPTDLGQHVQEYGCRRLSLQGELAAGRVNIETSSLSCRGIDAAINKASYVLPETGVGWRQTDLQADLRLALTDQAAPGQWLPPDIQDIRGELEIAGTISGAVDSLQGDLTVFGRRVAFKEFPSLDFQGKLRIEGNNLTLRDGIISRGGDLCRLSGTFPVNDSESFSAELEGRIEEIGEYVAPLLPDPAVRGDLSFSVEAAGRYREPHLSAHLQSGKIGVANRSYRHGELLAQFDGTSLIIKHLQVEAEEGLFEFSGTAAPQQQNWQSASLHIETLRLQGDGYQVSLAEPALLRLEPDRVTTEQPVLLETGFGILTLQGSAGNKVLDLWMSGTDLRRPEPGNAQLPGGISFRTASFQLHLSGTPETPFFSGSATVIGLSNEEIAAPMDGDFSFELNATGLEIKSCNLVGEQTGSASITGHLPITVVEGTLLPLPTPMRLVGTVVLPDLRLLHQFFPGYVEPQGAIHAAINLSGSLDKPKGFIKLQAKGVHPSSAIEWLPPGELQLDMRITAEENRLLLETVRVTGDNLEVSLVGSILGSVSLSDLVHFSAPKIAAEADLHGHLQLPELSWVAKRVTALRRVNGRLLTDFSVVGPLAKPKFEARVQISDIELRGSAALPVLRELGGQMQLDQEGITITSLHGLIGGSPAEVSGRIVLADLKPQRLDLRLNGKDLLLYRSDWGKIRCDAALFIKGTYAAPVIDGNLELTEGYYGRNINLLEMATSRFTSAGGKAGNGSFSLFSFTEEPLKNARFSIKTSGKEPITVNTNLAKGEFRPELLLSGTGELPQLTGEIFVDRARFNLPAGRLNIDAGLIHFFESDPDRPSLELTGNAKMMGYDITVKVDGPYDEPTISLSSYPSVANEDLLLLLLAGRRPPAGVAETRGMADMSRVAVYLGRELMTSLFGREYSDDESVLERLQLDIGRGITQQGEETIEARFLLTENLVKQNDAVYLTAEKDIWDDYNAGLRLIFRFR